MYSYSTVVGNYPLEKRDEKNKYSRNMMELLNLSKRHEKQKQ